jgi:hypothetical protein
MVIIKTGINTITAINIKGKEEIHAPTIKIDLQETEITTGLQETEAIIEIITEIHPEQEIRHTTEVITGTQQG